MLKITICPTCGSDKIKLVKRDWTSQYRGQSYTVLGLEYYECADCNEKVYDRQAIQRMQKYSPAFAKKRHSKVTVTIPVERLVLSELQPA